MKGLFYLAIIILSTIPSFAFAEITSPYTVDEKPKVIFGDSAVVGENEGLENYSYNYVGSYLHITFSYTHHGCCTAAYPPALYITSTDPRATTTMTVRDRAYVYSLSTQPIHRTDVYFYDIQFDSTGYTVKVNASTTDFTWVYAATTTEVTHFHREIPGLIQSDWASLANDFLLDAVLEGENPHSMSFTPVPIYEQTAPIPAVATTTPVIIVPGITSSVLKEGNSEKWPNIVLMTASFDDLYLDDLALDTNGNYEGSITATSVIRSTGNKDYYENLFFSLESKGYTEQTDLFEFPYDWRLDAEVNATRLNEKISQIKLENGVEKVHLVAHSMGGLLIKKYLKEFGGNSVEKFIDIGTPHNGAPKSYKLLNYGDDLGVSYIFGLVGFNPGKIKAITQNMPAVYQLLPSEDYFDASDTNYRYYVFNGVNGNSRLTFEETKSYMAAEGRNEVLIERADQFHQEIVGLNPGDYGVETYNFVGCGVPTIGQFYILDEEDGHYTYNIKMINGDGTVPIRSAEAMQASSTIYVRGIQHAVMPSASGVKETIAAILTSASTEDLDISTYSNLALSSNGCTVPNGKIVSFHSPIELHVYDQSGNHAGPDSNGDIENNIVGVVYEVIGDNKFAYLPEGAEFIIKGNATNSGTFDVRIQELADGEVSTTTIYSNITLTSATQAKFTIGTGIPTEINLDHDNDSIYEASQTVSTTTVGMLESTGRTIDVPVAVGSDPAQTSSSGQFTRDFEEIEVATLTPVSGEAVGEVETISPISQPNTQPLFSEEIQKETQDQKLEIEDEEEYENTAVVYKSLGYKFKIFLKTIWGWIKSWWI